MMLLQVAVRLVALVLLVVHCVGSCSGAGKKDGFARAILSVVVMQMLMKLALLVVVVCRLCWLWCML